ncbi:extracellular solute-binding protein [Streptomyces sp. NBC_01795]|uniref:ABC transporter substrate-binding protein n=1 Tax=unclassified Streptomyces TaxID=2593676 RepID=UPI002DDC0396|nr:MULTISPECIES: extracellular solute-binding protein [unclassified Streptomyces]WSA95870.1 extracellular solute-binding protein [Streptomyces sp. NBC_01795]WSB80287.1 extracellular solute-binding protein [Streptomyces sp. NBC_01775]WSS11504.1 extracellular solute-binding protein [Streptomyces sp. NBC_01186]
METNRSARRRAAALRTTARHTARPTMAAALLAVLALLVSACGALTPGSEADSGRPRTVPRSTVVPDEDVTLKLTFADAPVMVDALIVAFHKKHPNITVEPSYTQFADYVKSIKLTMASDSAPDLAQFAVGMDDIAARGDILDLAPYRDAYGWRAKFPAANLDQLTGSGKRAASGKHLYGVPAGLSMTGIYYNKELAKKAGITHPPRTLAEFEGQLAAAKKAGTTPLGVGALDSGGLHLWAALVNSMMPPKDYRDWVKGTPGATIKTKGTLAATKKLAEWSRKGYFDDSANGTAQVDSTGQFTRGESVFLINGNWAAGTLAEAMGKKAGFFLMPGTRPHARAVASGFSVSYAISSRTRHPRAAGAFLDFLGSREAAKIVSANGFLPPDEKAVPIPKGVLGEVARAHRRVTADNGINHFPDFTAPNMLDPLRSGVQKLIAGRVTPSAYLDSLQEVWAGRHTE